MRSLLLLSVSVVTGCAHQAKPLPPEPAPATAPAPVTHPPPTTAEACRLCRGDWGIHGLLQTETCNCRTNDGGKRCTDGADCQGVCVAGADAPEREVVSPGPPARGFFVGRCSELVTVYGCIRIIDRGVRAVGPTELGEPPGAICVD
jgi:hypothetical protein